MNAEDEIRKRNAVQRELDCILEETNRMIEVDYSELEMKVAIAAQDGKVFVDTETTEDIHTMNARKLFGVEEVTPKLRKKAKDAMFCQHYGGNPLRVVK